MRRTILAAALLLISIAAPWAQSGSASFQMPRSSQDGGAVTASSTSFSLSGTLGQPDATPPAASAGHTLSGGFHRQAVADAVFGDGFEAP